ncbi:hypothetical protein D3C80_1546250 [compost metagenome]
MGVYDGNTGTFYELLAPHVAHRISCVDRNTRVKHAPYISMIIGIVHLQHRYHYTFSVKRVCQVNREDFTSTERES